MMTLKRQGTALFLFLAFISLVPAVFQAQEPAEGSRKVLFKTPPVYPTVARSMNIRGTVKLEAHVGPNGSVKSVDVKGGHPLLAQSAIAAVEHWKFEPSPRDTKEEIEITFNPE